MDFIENFTNVKILIVGDVMIDRFWWGKVTRISPEAPVPVVKLEKNSLAAGGAANVAANVAGLGAQPFLVGVAGYDQEARLLPEILKKSNVGSKFIVNISGRQTTVKTRIIAHSQQIVRVDQESKDNLSSEDEQLVWEKIEDLINAVDVVVVSDYAKGLVTENLITRLITLSNKVDKKVLVDPKGKDFQKYRNAALLTPNFLEVSEAYKIETGDGKLLAEFGAEIISQLNLEGLLITRGEDGMSLFEKNKSLRNLPSLARNVYDVTGAGDTVIACLAVAVGSGMNFFEAAKFANFAAGLVVEQIGTTPITVKMLRSFREKTH